MHVLEPKMVHFGYYTPSRKRFYTAVPDVVISGTLFSDPKYYYYSGAASKDQKVSEFQLSW